MGLKPITFYQVGGSVRDEIMGLKSKDIDYVCECDSFETMTREIELRGKIYLSNPQFFTIRANIKGMGSCDYVLARKESGYTDGRHPDKVEPGTILDDLARRDFTVNAIAKNVSTGEIIDPFNGRADIEHKLLRCVGNARDRFTEDGLRLLRAMRFAITKDFELDNSIHECLTYPTFFVERLKGVSEERMREELFKCFKYSTLKTLEFFDHKSKLREYIFANTKLWLKPTSES